MGFHFLRTLASSGFKLSKDTTKKDILNYINIPLPTSEGEGKLKTSQYPHVQNMLRILDIYGIAIDTSPAGSGKTYSSSYLAKQFNLPVFWIGMKDSKKIVYDVATSYNVPIITITNYQMARNDSANTKGENPTKWFDMRKGYTEKASICPWIKKIVTKAKNGVDNKYKFVWKLPYKCFIVFDECHMGKNIETQSFAYIYGAIEAAKKYGHKVLLLSATPTENKDNLKSLFYFLGLVEKPDLNLVKRYLDSNIGKNSINNLTLVHDYLYDSNFGRMSAMPPPEPDPEDVKKYGLKHIREAKFVKLNEEDTQIIINANRRIHEVREKCRTKDFSDSLGELNRNRTLVEKSKINTFIDLIINADQKYKRICLFVNLKETLYIINDRLKEHYKGKNIKIGIYCGGEDIKDYTKAKEDYMNGNVKILLSTIHKGGVSLSLHDTIGDKETLVIISPPISDTWLGQVFGRHWRIGVKSSVTQYIIFADSNTAEEIVQESLSRKNKDNSRLILGKESDLNLSKKDLQKITSEMCII